MRVHQDSPCLRELGDVTCGHAHGRAEQWEGASICMTEMDSEASDNLNRTKVVLSLNKQELDSAYFQQCNQRPSLVGPPPELSGCPLSSMHVERTNRKVPNPSFHTRSIIILFSKERIKPPNQVPPPHGPVQATEKESSPVPHRSKCLPRLVSL